MPEACFSSVRFAFSRTDIPLPSGEGLGVGGSNKRCACVITPPRPQLALRATLPVKGRVVG